MPTTILAAPTKTNVGMGQISLGRDGDELISVLGSCVGLTLLHPRFRVAVLAHIVLPNSNGRSGLAGKFADTAFPEMLRMLAIEGIPGTGLVAKLAGGSNMFGQSGGPLQIGEANVAAVTELLAARNIRVIAKDLGGAKGRRITVDCQTGLVNVEVVGQGKVVL